ncbi:MAG: DUF2442 domain-containing protein [Chthoniobacterales bacterium]|nr:DUF2442 domain-containing protein [Chthoniobacterales bacterium]
MKIVAAKILKKFKVHLLFENGVSGVVDLADIAGEGVFKAWLEPGVFEQMTVAKFGSLEWPGDLDLCPDSLYLRLTSKDPEELFPSLTKDLAYA